MIRDITGKLARLTANAVIDKGLFEKTRQIIADYICASFAGYACNRQFNRAVEGVYMGLAGGESASVFGSEKRLPVCTAAFMNAVYAHGADMDDGNRNAMGHIGASVVSAVMAAAEAFHKTEDEVLRAIVVGYQVFTRLAGACQPGMIRRGVHSTGAAGAVACAAACAYLLGGNETEVASAVSMAATQASGLLIVGETGQLVKPLSPARAAETGVFSAMLAKRGIVGPDNPLESVKGWIHAFTDEFDEDFMFDGFERFNAVNECYFKPYPSCRHTQCCIEAGIDLHGSVDTDAIDAVNVYIYENAINLAGVIPYPKSADEAKFSIYYTLACALCLGRFGLEQLEVERVDKAVWALIPKIKLIPDSSMEDRSRGIRGARVEVVCGGSREERTVLIPKGDPEHPFGWDDISAKLVQCAAGSLDRQGCARLIGRVRALGGSGEFSYARLFER